MNTSGHNLHLYEEILLLALRDKKGTIHFGVNYQFALSGAIVAELRLIKRIAVEQVGKKKFIIVTNSQPFGDDILDEAILKIASAKRRQQIRHWVTTLANMRRLRHRAATNLVRRGILKLEESNILLIFKRKLYPEIDPRPEKRILDKMQDAIFTRKREIDPHTLVLVALSESAGLLKPNFDKRLLRERKSRIRDIVSGDLVGEATKEAIEAVQAAVMVAAIIPVVTAAAT